MADQNKLLSKGVLLWNSQNHDHQKYLRNVILLQGISQ